MQIISDNQIIDNNLHSTPHIVLFSFAHSSVTDPTSLAAGQMLQCGVTVRGALATAGVCTMDGSGGTCQKHPKHLGKWLSYTFIVFIYVFIPNDFNILHRSHSWAWLDHMCEAQQQWDPPCPGASTWELHSILKEFGHILPVAHCGKVGLGHWTWFAQMR